MCPSSGELYQYDIWYMSLRVDDRLVCITCVPDGHLHGVTHSRCRIDTIHSPDDGHIAVRNIQRIEINIHEKELWVNWLFTKKLTDL